MAEGKGDVEYTIKPEASAPAIPTSEWPLLLKNYDKCTLILDGVYWNGVQLYSRRASLTARSCVELALTVVRIL